MADTRPQLPEMAINRSNAAAVTPRISESRSRFGVETGQTLARRIGVTGRIRTGNQRKPLPPDCRVRAANRVRAATRSTGPGDRAIPPAPVPPSGPHKSRLW
jgi:hypothetical protein